MTNRLASRIFLSGTFISALVFSNDVLDRTLVPRFIALSIVLLITFLCMQQLEKERPVFELNAVSLAYICYFMVCVISISFSINKAEALFECLRVFTGLSLFIFFCWFTLQAPDFESLFLKGASLLTFIAIGYGAIQLYELNDVDIESLYKIISISGHKNLFSSLLFLLLIFNLAGSVSLFKIWRIVSAVAATLCIIFILLLQCRAVWLACIFYLLILGTIFFFKTDGLLVRLKKIAFGSLIAIAFLLGFLLAKGNLADFISRFNVLSYMESVTGQERLNLWEKTSCFMKNHLLLGVGAGNWQIYFPSCSVSGIWKSEMLNVTFQRPHNDFIWVFSETGLLGLSLYLLIIGIFIYVLYQIILQKNLKENLCSLLYLCGYISFLIIASLDFPKERFEHLLLFNALQGIIAARCIALIPLKRKPGLDILRLKPFVILVILFSIVVGCYRFKGEFYTRKLISNRMESKWASSIINCNNASSVFYSVDPTSIPIEWYKGVANFSLEQYDAAYADFEKAYIYHPYNHHVLNNLATSCELKGWHDKAINYYKEAIRINPRFDDPRLNLAVIYFNAKKYRDAYFWAVSCKNDSERKRQYLTAIKQKLIII